MATNAADRATVINFWLKLAKGVAPGTTTPKYAMMIWPNEAAFTACGSKLGFTYEQGKTKAGIDFTNSGIAEGAFTWSAGYTDGWKKDDARASHSMSRMENVDDFKGYAGMKQYFTHRRSWDCSNGPCQEGPRTAGAGFQFNANTKETGCKDANGKPVKNYDWNGMECTGESLTGASAGLHKNVCKKTQDNVQITCTHIGGTFNVDGSVLENAVARHPEDFEVFTKGPYCDNNGNGTFDDGEWPTAYGPDGPSCTDSTKFKPGELCSSIVTTTDAGKLAQLRCYADALHNKDGSGDDANSCVRDVRGNWNAKTPDEFLGKVDGPVKAKNQHVFDLFQFDSTTSGSLRSEERYFAGIQVGDNWTDCEVHEVFSLSLRKLNDTNDLLVELVSNERNVSTKPACIASYGEGKSKKYMFKMVKQ